MAGILEKRRSLHRQLSVQKQNDVTSNADFTQLQALANIGRATCMIAHEMNNLLTPLSGYSALALQNLHDSALTAKALGKVESNCLRASKLLDTMVAMVNGEKLEKVKCELAPMIDGIFACLCRDFKKDRIKVTLDIPEGMQITAVTAQIQQVLMNMLINARHAMLDKGGKLTIQATQNHDLSTISITDTGHGIAPSDLSKIFESFFTTKNSDASKSQSGSGLGLAFCKQIIECHNGHITVSSKPGHGTTFKITLPA